MNSRTLVSFVIFWTAGVALHATPTPADALLVLEKAQDTLVIVDPVSLTIAARVPVGENPHEVAVSDDGLVAYISNYGGNTISRVDLLAQKPLTPLDLGALRQPHGLDFVGGKLYFTAEGAKVVGRFDPVSQKIDWVMGTGQDRTHMVIASKDQKTVLTSNVNSGTISIIEQAPPGQGRGPGGPPLIGGNSNWTVTDIPVGRGSEGSDLTPDGKELWVANAVDRTIAVINLAEKKVVDTLPSTSNANRLKITLDGRYAFVSDLGGEDMLIIDVATRKPFRTIKMAGHSEGLLMSPDGARVYTTLNDHDSVAVIDLKTFAVTGEVKTGRGPDGLAWASRR